MRPAPIGSEVGLYFDSPTRVMVGDFIRTQSGRTYHLTSVRIQERGKHIGRQHLRAIVVEPGVIDPATDVVHPLYWYSRSRPSSALRMTNRGRLTVTGLQVTSYLLLLTAGAYYAATYVWIPA